MFVLQNDAETKAVREKIIELRTQVYKKTEQEVSLRWTFEEGVSGHSRHLTTRWPLSDHKMTII